MSIKKIAVLTSGGDSPGMNPALRSIVRSAIGSGLEVYGVKRGYQGLISNDMEKLEVSSVGNIIQKGGTFLYTSRCPEFKEKTNREIAYKNLKDRNIDALVVIGGDGSFKGAIAMNEDFGMPVIGLPGTIDNDISGTDYTIGFDTAVETAIKAVDHIRDTAFSSDRTFLIEVMGARTSSIAVQVGICTGAENVLLNNIEIDYKKIATDIKRGQKRGKKSSIIIVAEGEKPGRSYQISDILKNEHGLESKVCVLGHIQRGGSPSASDRFYPSVMGKLAIESLMSGKNQHAIVVQAGEVRAIPLIECSKKSDHVMVPFIGLTENLAI